MMCVLWSGVLWCGVWCVWARVVVVFVWRGVMWCGVCLCERACVNFFNCANFLLLSQLLI